MSAAVLATWLAALGAAAPAFACAAAGSVGDCCPDGGSALCTESHPAAPTGAYEACCAAVPTTTQAASFSPARVEQERLTDSGSPDLPILFCSTIALAQAAARRDWSFIIASPADRDGSSIYLRTLRLRL